MPRGRNNNKKKGGNNKKKRGAGHGKNSQRKPANANIHNNSNNRQTPSYRSQTQSTLPLKPEYALEGAAPSFQAFLDKERALHENYPTIYSRYKAATT